jgi:hypothetical protein
MRYAFSLTLALCAAAAPLHADLKFTTRMQMRDSASPPKSPADPVLTMFGTRLAETMLPGGSLEMTTTIGEKGLRVEWSTALPDLPAGSVMLGRPDGSVVVLNPALKTYWRMSAAAVKAMTGGPAPTVTTKKTGEFSDVAGVRCETVTFAMRIPIPPPPADKPAPPGFPAELTMDGESCIAEKYQSYSRMLARVPGLTTMGGEKLAEDGLPLRQVTRSAAFGAREMESLVTKIAEESVPASAYEIPAGFKEVPAPGGGK